MTTKEFSELLGDFQKLTNYETDIDTVTELEHHLSAKFSWIKTQMFDVLNLSEGKGGLPVPDRIEMANDTLQILQKLIITLENECDVRENPN